MTTTLNELFLNHETEKQKEKQRKIKDAEDRITLRQERKTNFVTADCKEALKQIDYFDLKSRLEKNAANGKKYAMLFDIDKSSGFFNHRYSSLQERELVQILNQLGVLEKVTRKLEKIGLCIDSFSIKIESEYWLIPLGLDIDIKFNKRWRIFVEWK